MRKDNTPEAFNFKNGILTTYLYPLQFEENDVKYKEYIFIIIFNKTIF